jgi:hypothetical protein
MRQKQRAMWRFQKAWDRMWCPWQELWSEIIRDRRRCDLPWATGGGTVESCSASSVVCLCDFVIGLLATSVHCVSTWSCGDESSSGSTGLRSVRKRPGAGSAETMTKVRRSRAGQVRGRCLARVKSQGHRVLDSNRGWCGVL